MSISSGLIPGKSIRTSIVLADSDRSNVGTIRPFKNRSAGSPISCDHNDSISSRANRNGSQSWAPRASGLVIVDDIVRLLSVESSFYFATTVDFDELGSILRILFVSWIFH